MCAVYVKDDCGVRLTNAQIVGDGMAILIFEPVRQSW
jgi:hypothetical protein